MPFLQTRPITVTPTDQLLDAQRQQALADILTKGALTTPQAPSGGMYQAKLGIGAALAPVAEALLANRQQQKATDSMKGAFAAQRDAQSQAIASLLGGSANGSVGPTLAPASQAVAAQSSSPPPSSTVTPGAAPAPITSDSAPPPDAAPPPVSATAGGPNFVGALNAAQAGIDPQLIGKILDSQMPTDEIKNLRAAGASPQDISDAILGKARKDALTSVGEHDTLLGPRGEVVRAGAPTLPTGMYGPDAEHARFNENYLRGEAALRQAGATNVNVNAQQKYPNAFNDALGKADADRLTTYQKSADGAVQMLGTLDQLEKLNPKSLSGGGAEARANVANWLSGWTGVNIVDAKTLANTQEYNALTSRAILDSLGGSLGTGVSNADVAFIKNTVPKLEYSAEARQQLIGFLRNKASSSIDLYTRARDYGEAHQGLKGFDAFPVSNPQTPRAKRELKRNPDGSYNYGF